GRDMSIPGKRVTRRTNDPTAGYRWASTLADSTSGTNRQRTTATSRAPTRLTRTVLQSTTMTRIRFSSVEPRFTRVAVDGEYPLLQYAASQVNVNMLLLNLPLVFKS
ncbi:MAG: hypothetical protein K8R91_05105, partial [Phycisphaerae bacterium]|nr:hypothetical protein [Phycisphaerae bacterium]